MIAACLALTGQAAEQTWAEKPLEQALLALGEQGLKLIFTDRVVRPEMRVEREPAAGEPRAILDELLAPHGLAVRDGAAGTLIVVPAAARPGSVGGIVRDWDGGQPLRRVAMRLVESGQETITGDDGRFLLAGVAAGRYFLQASRPGYVLLQTEIRVEAGESRAFAVELRPIPLTFEEIDVHARHTGLAGEGISTLRLERRDLLALPRLGEDVLRPLTLLPGIAGNDLSARLHVRGGRSDEVLVRLDGLEILEPYHLLDFQSALSIVAPDAVGEVELLTGGFGVQYGDRMSGVLDLTSREPAGRHTDFGLTDLLAEAAHSAPLPADRGGWLATLRTGSLEPAARLAHEEENPSFTDAFAKLDLALADGQSLVADLLWSDDRLDFTEALGQLPEGEDLRGRVRFRTRYANAYAWIRHQAVFGTGLVVGSKASLSRVERDREGNELAAGGSFSLDDHRRLSVAAAAQDWSAAIGGRHELKWGVDVSNLDLELDYFNERALSSPQAAIGHRPPTDAIDFERRADGRQLAVYLADRFRPTQRLQVEAGLRHDLNNLLDDEVWSPRLSLAWQPRPRQRLDLAWGFFHQSQRLYELQVEDGETRTYPAERAEQRIVGFEQAFGREGARRRPLTLRLEVYEHRIDDPRPRYENLLEPVSLAPETEADRVRIAPESSRARGLEVFLTFGGRRFDGFASYALSRATDRIDGRDVPRSLDQPHALKLDLGYRAPWRWDFNLAFELHTGWPTTAISATTAGTGDDLEIVPVLGPLRGERLPTYRRLDLRASRRFALARGELEVFLDVQNATFAKNVRGFELFFEEADGGGVEVVKDAELWSPMVPSLGIRWSF